MNRGIQFDIESHLSRFPLGGVTEHPDISLFDSVLHKMPCIQKTSPISIFYYVLKSQVSKNPLLKLWKKIVLRIMYLVSGKWFTEKKTVYLDFCETN